MNPIRGTKDLDSREFAIFNSIIEQFSNTSNLYGFSGISVPILEHMELFSGIGETSDIVQREMYMAVSANQEREVSEKVALRPEATSSVVRFLGSNGLLQNMPQKLYTYGPMFRYERPQKGRLRQLHQFSLESFGDSSPLVDAEVIKCALDCLTRIGIMNLPVKIEINTLGDSESRANYRSALVKYFEKYTNTLSSDSKIRLEKNPLRILDSKDENDIEICKNAPIVLDHLNPSSEQFFSNLKKILDSMKIKYEINPRLVRGLDYYNHTVFEFKLDSFGSQSTILGGGRYDNLVNKIFKKDIPAVGWGAGIDRLMMIVQENNIQFKESNKKSVSILIWNENHYCNAVSVANKFRENGIISEIILEKDLTSGLKKSDKRGFDFAAILGENEINSGKFALKNMRAKQENVILPINFSYENISHMKI
jgi:histidyl-tRNA synthetase